MLFRIGIVTVGLLAITAASLYAGSGLLRDDAVCPAGMLEVASALTFTCVDEFEVSAAPTCPHELVENQGQTVENVDSAKCVAESKNDTTPWRFINREQAMVACARAGKRLPTASEWYHFSLGSPKDSCNIDSGAVWNTGKNATCRSAAGAVDVLGNVWEWVSDDVWSGMYQNRPLPQSGFITQSDQSGVAVYTRADSSEETAGYIWTNMSQASGMLRGGFYSIREDAHITTIQADVAPTFFGPGVGFRCVR